MKRIPVYKFFKHKYGSELLIDIVDYANMRADIKRTPVFTETFYSITLVIDGNERVEVNGEGCRLRRGLAICSIPGEVWNFPEGTTMTALNLVFEKDFLLSFFRDPHFLNQFGYLRADRPSPFLNLGEELYSRILALYREMRQEIIGREHKDQHILRAMLYETLMLLKRADIEIVSEQSGGGGMPLSRFVERFMQLVDDNYAAQHGTQFYAGELCITSNYLNKIVRQALGKSTKAYIESRIMRDACRQLRYTTLSVQEIARRLGYDTPTYFVRSFRKQMGMTPLEYRKQESPEK